MSQRPRFPAVLYYPDCGVEHFSEEAELCSQSISFRLKDLFLDKLLVDTDGVEWEIDAIGASKVSLWQRIRHMSRGDQVRTVQVEYRKSGMLTLDELKQRTQRQIDLDPGDLMMQFVDEEDLRAGVAQADSIAALIEFLRKVQWDEVYADTREAPSEDA